MTKFIHITDLHLVAPGERLYGLDPLARLLVAFEDIGRYHSDAAFILITGDLAHRGDPSAYLALREALAGLPMPVHLVIGNHDNRDCLRRIFPEAASDEHGFVQAVIDTPAGALLIIDTNEPGTHQGWICQKRMASIERMLHLRQGQPLLVAMHHPLQPIGLPAMDAIGLVQQDALAAMLRSHDQVRHIFFGHVHRPIHGQWAGINFSSQYGLNHQVALQFDPAATELPGNHELPAYGVAFADPNSIVIHTHSFLDRSPQFDLYNRDAERAQSVEDLMRVAPFPRSISGSLRPRPTSSTRE